MKIIRTSLALLVLLLVGSGLGIYFYRSCTRESETKPEVTPLELRAKITQRLRLITQEITYRQSVKAYSGDYMAEGVADLVAYVKFDLEHLKIQEGGGDTLYVSLPMPQVELGRRPSGSHSIKYYRITQSLFGTRAEATSDRTAIKDLETKVLSRAYEDIMNDPRFLPKAKADAREQLQQLLTTLAPNRPIILVEEVQLPGEGRSTEGMYLKDERIHPKGIVPRHSNQ